MKLLHTQFYDKVDEYKTLEYNKMYCRLEEHEQQHRLLQHII